MTTTTPPSAAGLNLSPTALHHKVMAQLTPSLAYDGGDVAAWQNRLRPKLLELLGWDQMPLGPNRCPLNVRTVWTREHELGTISRIVFTAEPGADVPAFLCLPRDVKPPYPVFICVQGHSTGMHNSIAVDREDNSKTIEVAGDRDFALGCLRRGIAALCIEQRSLGERCEQHQEQLSPHGCHDAVMHALMLGRTMAGERVFDVDRGIDLLTARDDMDLTRLGVMGNSGGGTTTMYAAAVLDRVRFAMPSCVAATFESSLMRIYHCADNYVPRIMRYAEVADVLGLFAPRPLVVVAGEQDDIFPIEGVREAFAGIRHIYRAAGAEDNCKLAVGAQGHRFYEKEGWGEMLPFVK